MIGLAVNCLADVNKPFMSQNLNNEDNQLVDYQFLFHYFYTYLGESHKQN